MGKPRVARDPIELHPVALAVSKARALAWTLGMLGDEWGANDLRNAVEHGPDDTRGWLHLVVEEALLAELDTIGREFRKSLTPEQVREQIIGGPKAVA
jgi:hypothetical protein